MGKQSWWFALAIVAAASSGCAQGTEARKAARGKLAHRPER